MEVNNMDKNQQIFDLAEHIQEECHKTVEYIMANSPKVERQYAVNAFIFTKLAEIELQIKELRLEVFLK